MNSLPEYLCSRTSDFYEYIFLAYYSRLQVLGLKSLEIRRLRTDVLLVYRIMFGMVRLNSNEFSP